jgi:signal peptidase II
MLPDLPIPYGTEGYAGSFSLKQSKQDALILPVVAGLVVLFDQLTKHLVAAWLEVGQSWSVVPRLASIFRITYVTNAGVAFGMFPGASTLFAIIPVVAVLAILVYGWSLPANQALMRMALALPLGGAIGNLADRLRHGSVVDFIDLSFWPLRQWPIFNLADASIVTGVGLMMLLMLWEERREREEQRAVEDG